MPRPCTVCTRKDRNEIDRRLSFQVVNLSEMAREFGVSRDALTAHRRNHIPTFLPAFQASADALTLGTLQAEAQRLYSVTLDALAQAEAGVLQHADGATAESRLVSSTAIAKMIKEARAGLTLLVKISADAGNSNEAPMGVANGELDASIRAALVKTMERNKGRSVTTSDAIYPIDPEGVRAIEVNHGDLRSRYTEEVVDGAVPIAPLADEAIDANSARGQSVRAESVDSERTFGPGEGGGHVGQDGGVAEVCRGTISSVTPSENPLEQNGHSDLRATLPKTIVHPKWEGSASASKEEREAAGYADIPLETPDDRIPDDVLAEALKIARNKMAGRNTHL